MAAAQAPARRAVEAIEPQARERTEAGLLLDGLPDLSAKDERDGFYQAQLGPASCSDHRPPRGEPSLALAALGNKRHFYDVMLVGQWRCLLPTLGSRRHASVAGPLFDSISIPG